MGHGKVGRLAFLWRRIGLGHVARVRHDEGSVAGHGAAYLQLGGRVAGSAICELVEQHPRLIDHDAVLLLLLGAGGRVHAHVARADHGVVLVTLRLAFTPLLLTHSLCRRWVLVLAPIELLCAVLLQLLLSLAAQVQQGDGLVQEVVLDLLVDRAVGSERGQ